MIYHRIKQGRPALPPGKEQKMIMTIFMVFTIISFLGIVGENEKYSKRTYCYAFMVCVAAVTVLERGLL